MRHLKLIVIAITIILTMTSCLDIADTDNPVKSPVNPIVEPKINYEWDFSETYQKQDNHYFWQQVIYIRNEVEFDSVENQVRDSVFKRYFINIDLEVENDDPDYTFDSRVDHISTFRIKMDSIFLDNQYKPIPMRANNEIIEFKIELLNKQDTRTIDYLEKGGPIVFSSRHDKMKREIEVNFGFVFLPFQFETLAFSTHLEIEYP